MPEGRFSSCWLLLRAAAAANCSALSTAACAIIFLCQLSKKVALAASLGCSFGLFDCFWFGFLDLIFDFFLIVVACGLRPAPGRHPPLHPYFVPTIASLVGGISITGQTSKLLVQWADFRTSRCAFENRARSRPLIRVWVTT